MARLGNDNWQVVTGSGCALTGRQRLASSAHALRNSGAERDLIYGAVPGTDVRDGLGGGEAADVAEELGGGLETFLSQPESQVVNLLFSKDKFLGVEGNAPQAALVKEGAGGLEVGLNVITPEQTVINTFHMVLKITDYFI